MVIFVPTVMETRNTVGVRVQKHCYQVVGTRERSLHVELMGLLSLIEIWKDKSVGYIQ